MLQLQKRGVWIKEQGSKLKDGGPMANKRMIILLYTDPIGYADSPPLSTPSGESARLWKCFVFRRFIITYDLLDFL